MNDVHEWILEKNGKKTVVRCETNPYESLGMVSKDSLHCTISDYTEGDRIPKFYGDKIKHIRAKIQIAPDFLELNTTRGRK